MSLFPFLVARSIVECLLMDFYPLQSRTDIMLKQSIEKSENQFLIV